MPNSLSRYAAANVVPTRSMIDQLLEGSFFAPAIMDRWFNQGGNFPANLIATDESYVVQIGVPGLKAESLEVHSLNRELRIKGSYGVPSFEGSHIWSGLPTGEFSQTFTLPAEVAGDGAEASYNNGILTVTLPKSERTKVKNIPVKTTA